MGQEEGSDILVLEISDLGELEAGHLVYYFNDIAPDMVTHLAHPAAEQGTVAHVKDPLRVHFRQ